MPTPIHIVLAVEAIRSKDFNKALQYISQLNERESDQLNTCLVGRYTLLHWLTDCGGQMFQDLLPILLERGLDINYSTAPDMSSGRVCGPFRGSFKKALHVAVNNCDYQTIETLLANGADTEVTDGLGYTPLHYAAHKDFSGAAQLLLHYGARTNALNDNEGDNSQTPLDLALSSPGITSNSVAAVLIATETQRRADRATLRNAHILSGVKLFFLSALAIIPVILGGAVGSILAIKWPTLLSYVRNSVSSLGNRWQVEVFGKITPQPIAAYTVEDKYQLHDALTAFVADDNINMPALQNILSQMSESLQSTDAVKLIYQEAGLTPPTQELAPTIPPIVTETNVGTAQPQPQPQPQPPSDLTASNLPRHT